MAGTAEPAGAVLPGAQQLELARRVNPVGRPSADLLERLLASTRPAARGPHCRCPAGPPCPTTAPVRSDPDRLGAEELLDLVAVVLAQEVAQQRPEPPPAGTRRPWAPRYRLDGDPELGRELRRHLTAHGRPPSARPGRLVVLGTDAGTMLADLWTHRALGEGVAPWDLWWRRTTSRDRLPGRLDLAAIAARGLERGDVGVRVVTDPAAAPRAAGLRRPLPDRRPLAATAVDLGRRVVAELRPAVPADARRLLASEVLRPRLASVAGPPPVLPAAHRAWTQAHAERMVVGLERYADRYPVSGSLGLLLPGDRPGAEAIRPRDTLATGIGLLLAGDGRTTREEGT